MEQSFTMVSVLSVLREGALRPRLLYVNYATNASVGAKIPQDA